MSQIASWCLMGLAVAAGCRGLALLLLRKPAPARVIHDGYRRQRAAADAAFIRDRAPPMPLWIEDRIAFVDPAGNDVRADLRRLAVPASDMRIVWFDRARPQRVTAERPLLLIGLSLVMAAAGWRIGF